MVPRRWPVRLWPWGPRPADSVPTGPVCIVAGPCRHITRLQPLPFTECEFFGTAGRTLVGNGEWRAGPWGHSPVAPLALTGVPLARPVATPRALWIQPARYGEQVPTLQCVVPVLGSHLHGHHR